MTGATDDSSATRDPTQGPDDTPAALGELLSSSARAIHFEARRMLAPLGITPAAARALRTLARGDGTPLRMVDLAERMHVVPRTVTTLVDALEADELIERRPDPNDRRSTLVHLTPRGHERLEQARQARHQAAGQLMSVLDEADQAQLRTLLERLRAEADRMRDC